MRREMFIIIILHRNMHRILWIYVEGMTNSPREIKRSMAEKVMCELSWK
jgi:hypothetical protein